MSDPFNKMLNALYTAADLERAKVEAALEQREADANEFDDPNWTSLIGTNVSHRLRSLPLAPGTQHLLDRLLATARLAEHKKACPICDKVPCDRRSELESQVREAKERK
jgi:hypothetical protein